MNRKSCLATAALMVCLMANEQSNAQTTGSFDTSINFMSAPRAVSLYVPPSYTSATAHKLMVCLHGLGDTCTNYRTALAVGSAWAANMPNTIFVCPESWSRNADYYYPAGGEDIVQACIDLARSIYNIDTTEIVLQGFSLGGRAALKYGLDHTASFKGLLLNTPAIQGVKQAINGGPYTFTYANAPQIPIYITHGATDVLYTGPIDTTYEQLVLNNGIVRYREYPGLGHALPAIAGMIEFRSFFNAPKAAGFDLDIVKPVIAAKSCAATQPASCLVRNTGTDTIHNISLDFTTSSGVYTQSWTGSIAPYQHAFVAIPAVTAPVGDNMLTVKVKTLDGGATDTIVYNNSKTAAFNVQTSGLPTPYFEGFEAAFPPANWTAYTAGDVYAQWDKDTDVKKTGSGSMYAFNTILVFDNAGRVDEMATPAINLTTGIAPRLTFDVAYNYHHYMPPVTLIDTTFADTLSVMISTDCGDHYTTIYKKGGSQLETFASPILNPTSIAADYIDPADSNWRLEDIDLSAYAASDKAIVKFSYKSSLGGSINIDNVKIDNSPVGVVDVWASKVAIYPNPANATLVIGGAEQMETVIISDVTGRIMKEIGNNGEQKIAINIADLANGIYTAKMKSARSITTYNFVVAH